MKSNSFHTSVLLKEAIDFLQVRSGRKYIDATIGGGGHGVGMLKKGGIVLGIDVEKEAIEYASRRWKLEARRWNMPGDNLVLVRGNFKDIGKIAQASGFDKVAGVLFDLGVSRHQLEAKNLGFSFQTDSKLDMRADKSLKVTAADLVNGLTKDELYELFTKMAQEHYAWAISNSIVRARKVKPIEKTAELVRLIVSVYRKRAARRTKLHPATRVFQALRIAVNDELNSLREALPAAFGLLDLKGRLIVISFHSLEDRIAKEFFKAQMAAHTGKILTEKPIVPSIEEIGINPSARSAKMRVFEHA